MFAILIIQIVLAVINVGILIYIFTKLMKSKRHTIVDKWYRELQIKTKALSTSRLRMFDTFMKVIIFIVVMHGLIMVTLSYVLAFLDKVQIAESLSQTVVTEIIAPVTVYGITKTIENVSKYNKWVEMFTQNKKEDSEWNS